ncbi:MAG: HNH endonuclease [bacterium]|nr:HNH endonuclease [bacterium]
MTYLSEDTRRRVRRRAGNRCEYCLSHQDYVLGRLQIDHVIPIIRGGPSTEDNLCLACELCNQYKWAKTEGRDPETLEVVSLFHPRRQSWPRHFAWSTDGTKIIGLTACGRATVIDLGLNNPLAVTVRRNWIGAGWHPPTPVSS